MEWGYRSSMKKYKKVLMVLAVLMVTKFLLGLVCISILLESIDMTLNT